MEISLTSEVIDAFQYKKVDQLAMLEVFLPYSSLGYGHFSPDFLFFFISTISFITAVIFFCKLITTTINYLLYYYIYYILQSF